VSAPVSGVEDYIAQELSYWTKASIFNGIAMLLTLTTTHQPATDLGFLLHKHPDKHQEFSLPFGTAHVFYPEADPSRCTVALVLDVDPIGHPLAKLARGIDWSSLKHMHNLSDETLCERWLENPYYQPLCGEDFFCHSLPFDRSSMTRWRQRMGRKSWLPRCKRACTSPPAAALPNRPTSPG
jgi:hypothetical protein